MYKTDSDYNEKEGLYICAQDQLQYFTGDNVFRCSHGMYIPIVFVCDDKRDYPRNIATDEVGCECNATQNYSSQCKVIKTTSHNDCSNFYVKSLDGTCMLYGFTFGEKINDKMKSMAKQGSLNLQQSILSEQNQGKISCHSINSSILNFYDISDICSYKLNEEAQLIPCNKGEHLQNCQFFECNMVFKCPDFYCIPWGYICDGKWDCPSGYDESFFNQCNNTTCTNMFQFKMSSKCIHLNDVCNEHYDCPFEDDEYLCLLKDISCPSGCQCFSFAMRCYSTDVLEYALTFYLPYKSVTIVDCSLASDNKLKKSFQYVSFLSITNTNFENICTVVSLMKHIKILDVSRNAISKLKIYCIKNKITLAVIKLNNNRLHFIEAFAFYNLTSLQYIDLSNNMLTIFQKNFMTMSDKLSFLALENNTLKGKKNKDILNNLNLKFLIIEHFALCCFKMENVKCSTQKLWYMSCSHLLIDNTWLISFCFISFLIVCTNLLQALVQIKYCSKKQKARAYDSIVSSICITDITVAVPLLILWLGDIYFEDNFIFVEDQWKSSVMCFVSGGINVYYGLTSTYLNILLSFSRYQVIKYPMNSNFKKRDYVFQIIVIGCLVIFVFTTLTVTLFWWSSGRIPTAFCSPLFDPSRTHSLVKYLTFFTIVVHFVAVFVDLIINSKLVVEVTAAKNIEIMMPQNLRCNSESRIQLTKSLMVQIMCITCSHFLCWMSSVLILLITTLQKIYPLEVILWSLAYVLPLNSILILLIFLAKTLIK